MIPGLSVPLSVNQLWHAGQRQRRLGEYLVFFFVSIAVAMSLSGCSHFNDGYKSSFKEANDYFNHGSYDASLNTYRQIVGKYPEVGDRALFEMGIIYGYARNEQRDYRKSLECFEKVIEDYPASMYRKDSQTMAFNVNTVIAKDRTITAQQAHIETLQQAIQSNGREIAALRKNIGALEQEVKQKEKELEKKNENEASKLPQEDLLIQGPADKILIEKKERRLKLISKGKVLKTYKIALGGNPNGPKERLGDNKTPEGTYIIDSRRKDSIYHLSLHISYPNEKDRKRARQLGVSPGGDIMIHGIKNTLAWAGEQHTKVDWTKGCIAVTDKEIEEIDRLVPNGTVVVIRAGSDEGSTL